MSRWAVTPARGPASALILLPAEAECDEGPHQYPARISSSTSSRRGLFG